MHLTLTPQFGLPGQPETTIHVEGDTLTLDGLVLDLSRVAEGDEFCAADQTALLGPVRRIGGVIHASILARLGDTAADTQGGPWVVRDAAGSVAIPAARRPSPEEPLAAPGA
jgi:hypothetical protein